MTRDERLKRVQAKAVELYADKTVPMETRMWIADVAELLGLAFAEIDALKEKDS